MRLRRRSRDTAQARADAKAKSAEQNGSEAVLADPSAGQSQRLLSLDVFRGLSVLLMLLVNNIGRGPGISIQLKHAGWSPDIHLADLAFPWFIFIVGAAIPFSVASARRKKVPTWRYDLRVLRRALLLFALGSLLLSLDKERIVIRMGVLQLIGIDYFVASMLYDLPAHRRALLSALLLIGYWIALRYIPVPSVGTGMLEEGRNLVQHINSVYLWPIRAMGLPVVIPTAALAMIGALIGDLIRCEHLRDDRKALWLVSLGALMAGVAVLWSINLHFNKPLWTSSFILFTAGAGTALLGVFYYLLDVRHRRRWAFPLAVFGANALVAYVPPIIVKTVILRPLGISTRGWLHVSVYIAIWWLICWLLYRRRWLLRV